MPNAHAARAIVILPLVLLGLCSGELAAAAYVGNEFSFSQPDGSRFAVRLWGDERSVRVETPDGWTLIEDASRWWCYAIPDRTGGIAPSATRVGAGDPTVLGAIKHLRPSREQTSAIRRKRTAELGLDDRGHPLNTAQPSGAPGASMKAAMPAPPSKTTTGTKHGLTVMVKFSDHLTDAATISKAQVVAFCNGGTGGLPAYTEFENNGSVYQYYYDNSFGKLAYTNRVVDYVLAPQTRAYYAATVDGSGIPVNRSEELVKSALDLVSQADLQAADADGDKVLDAVNIFYAGDCPNNWSQGLWPHMSSFHGAWSGHGYTALSYQMTNMGDHLAIGTFCHENGHMLCGFPDLYDYDDDSSGSAGFFSLMASGNYAGSYQGTPNQGTNPVRIDGYLATAAGWRTVVDYNLSTPATVVTATAENATIFRYLNPVSPTEYFLFENRRTANRDAGIPGSGLAIWHVDERGNRDNQSFAKNSSHANFELALVQADNLHQFELTLNYYGDANDLWYQGNAAAGYTGTFNDGPGATPTENNARWWDGSLSGLSIEQISAPGSSMTFTIGHRTVSVDSASASFAEGNSGTTYANVSVSRTGLAPVSVQYATSDGTATIAGLDYTAVTGTLSWAKDDVTSKTISVPILGDTTPEPNETFNVILSNPTGATLGTTTTTVTITNDDGAAPAGGSLQLAGYAYSCAEGAAPVGTPLSIPVKRVGGSTGTATVHWHIVPGTASTSDYSPSSGDLNWGDADSADKPIHISLTDNALPEADKTFSIILDAPSGTSTVIAPTPNKADVTILNDDATFSFLTSSQMVVEPTTGPGTAYLVVHRTGTPHGAMSVDYATSDGTAVAPFDYASASGTLSFADGVSDKQIPITILADTIASNRRNFTVTVSNPIRLGATGSAALDSIPTTLVDIWDQALIVGKASSGSATNGGLAGKCGAGAVGMLLAGAMAVLALRRRRR